MNVKQKESPFAASAGVSCDLTVIKGIDNKNKEEDKKEVK